MLVSTVWPSVETIPLNTVTWQESKWYRPDLDLVSPGQVIISGGNIKTGLFACILEFPVLITPIPGEYFHCPTRWRGKA